MAGRIATAADELALVQLWENAKAARLALWPRCGAIPLDRGECWVSTDAQGIRLGLIVRIDPLDVHSLGVVYHIDEWILEHVGPRPGLTAAQRRAATADIVGVWIANRKLTRPNPWICGGLVPAAFNATLKAPWDNAAQPTWVVATDIAEDVGQLGYFNAHAVTT